MSDQLALIAGLIAAVLLIGAGCWLAARRQLIMRRDGIIACALRQAPDAAWRRGLAEYQPARLCWHRSVSLRLKPAVCFDRAGLTILASRAPAGRRRAASAPAWSSPSARSAGPAQPGALAASVSTWHSRRPLSPACWPGWSPRPGSNRRAG